MIFALFRKRNNNRAIVERQYAALTAGARQAPFYSAMQVPDTVMGRLEMLSIAMILYFRRTGSGAQQSGREIAQEIIDAFFEDIDHSIRELGVGDQSVPKRMKKLAGNFYGRVAAYGKALDARDRPALAQALARNLYPDEPQQPAMEALADWMIFAEETLAAAGDDAIAAGNVTLPPAGGAEA